MKELSASYLSEFCQELGMLLRAGVTLSDSLLILRDDDDDKSSRTLMNSLHESALSGSSLSSLLEDAAVFPDYLISSVRLGERSGKLDDTLLALSEYYDQRAHISASLRSAIIYPVALLILMAAVVVVLITRVLPIFSEVFAQLGAQMSPLAVGLMRFGGALSSASAVLLGVLGGIMLLALLCYIIPPARRTVSALFRNAFGDKGVMGRIASTRFASAMSTAISAGLPPETAIELAGKVCGGAKGIDRQISRCMALLEQGEGLEACLSRSGIFTARDSRMLSLGVKTGSTDDVMSDIARRGEEQVIKELDDKLGRIEPTLVIIISVVVGIILLSVLMPLMGIMTSIG